MARSSGLLRLFGLADRERLIPAIEKEFFFSRLGQTFAAEGKRRARVALFAGCISQVSFAALHEATIRVLTANGCEVVVPDGQLCCGALPAHAGVRDIARQLARVNLDVFLRGDFDAVIANAAGCGSTLKEYAELFSPDDPAHEKAQEFHDKMRDATEFLDGLGLTAPMGEVRMRVTYQDSCHLAHGQKIRESPRRLISAVPGIELTEMRLSDNCCGSAGVYNVTQTQTSLELLAEKMRCAAETGAAAIVTTNPGCMLQMRAGSEIFKTGQQVLHVMELLDQAIDGAAPASPTFRQ
jgi:glycolate oxidase iron-sulfur subunit